MAVSNRGKRIPKRFRSAWEAGKFWDTHSAADYWDEMEEVEIEFDVRRRVHLVPVDGRVYRLARKRAQAERRTVGEIVNSLLDRSLAKSAQA